MTNHLPLENPGFDPAKTGLPNVLHQPKSRPAKRLAALGCLLSALALTGCADAAGDELNQPLPQPVAAHNATAPTAEPAVGLVLSGEIAADANRTARVFPRVGGQVLRLTVELGDEVGQGQVLAVLRSSEIADLQNQHTAGTADLAVAQKNLAVTQEFYQAGLAAGQDVFKARAEVARATGTTTKNRQQLGAYTIGKEGLYELRAPVSGFITAKNMAAGMRFNAGHMQAAFTVTSLDSVWVMANVFESDLTQVHRGQAVEITTLSYPDQPLQGRIDQLFHLLDHDSKVMKVRCTLANPGHRLKPGMHAQVRVLAQPIQ